ncbi:MAG: glycoside hydrolase family 97 catalytic domain-containing protein [Bacteroidota bacterium]
MRLCFLILLLFQMLNLSAQKKYVLRSPDGSLALQLDVGEKLHFSLSKNAQTLLERAEISLQSKAIPRVLHPKGKARMQTGQDVTYPMYGKRSRIQEDWQELSLVLKEGLAVQFRLYNQGLAYRFRLNLDEEEIELGNEVFVPNFQGEKAYWAAIPNGFVQSYEDFYQHITLSEWKKDAFAMMPLAVEWESGIKMVVTESDLKDYPGLYIGKQNGRLQAVFPQYVLEDAPGGHMNFHKEVSKRADYIAKIAGTRDLPWRLMVVSTEDKELLDNDLVYLLARKADSQHDFSWVKPGKVAWDWWNDWNLKGVPFEAGINVETYRYYIDFAAKYGLDYINLDEGWSDQFDLMEKKLDVESIIDYAHRKGVGVFLWCVARTLDDQMDEAMDQFAEWGVDGLKVDFMDRDDQSMVEYYWRIAEAAADHKLLVNFHGAYKPTGMQRAFPNVINHEAVRGLEYNKFSKPHGTTPDHALCIPFIRMVAGYMDYTPGGLRNVQKEDFYVSFSRTQTQGTRCQQLAMYIVFEAPLQMLADAPTAYETEPAMMGFLAPVPTTWDETIALDGKLGEYAIIARRKGNEWYVGAMTNWQEREVEIDLSFLGKGLHQAHIWQDGPNAAKHAEDYTKVVQGVRNDDRLNIRLAPGGGAAIRIFAP